MKQCPLQELCRDFNTGNNKPPNHDIRNKEICKHWLDMSCSAIPELYKKIKGKAPSCEIDKVKRIKKGVLI